MSDERLAEINKRAGWVMRKLNLDVAGFPLSSGESVAKRVLREDIPWLLARVRELEAQLDIANAAVDDAQNMWR